MPIWKGKQEKPGESPANRGGGLGSGNIDKSPFSRTAEYPGFKNRKQAARGGTRRAVLRGKIQDVVEEKTTRREKPLPVKDKIRETAAAIAKEREKQLKREQERREKAEAKKRQVPPAKQACTCRSPRIKNGVCTRCRKAPSSPRKRGLFG